MHSLRESIERLKRIVRLYEAKYDETAEEDRRLLLYLEELKKYKETGLTPEQIIEIDKLYAQKCKEVEKMKKEISDD